MSKPATITPLPCDQMLARASTALGKVDLYGPRGLTMISAEETEALVLTLAALGLVSTPPGAPAPNAFFLTSEGAVK